MFDTAALVTVSDLAQRRIDLLAIEQNAWRLAGLDTRCVVVSTRTELEWGMKNGQISVWAPSKIVLDAVDSPAPKPRDSVALAQWLAEVLQADHMLVVGDTAPITQNIPVKAVVVARRIV